MKLRWPSYGRRTPVTRTAQPAKLKFATWNIGGGILGESHQRNGQPSLDYYVSVLREHEPDVVCLQEAHSFADSEVGQSQYLARQLGYPHLRAFPISESHMASDACLTLAILSRYPIRTCEYRKFPNLGLTAVGPDGNFWKLLDKGYAKAIVEFGERALGVLNAHCFPLHYFRAKPTEERFAPIWKMLADDLLEMRDETPTIAGMDLNYARIQDLLSAPLKTGNFVNAFANTPTTAKGIQQDFILFDRTMTLLDKIVQHTESDHSYCQVEVEVATASVARAHSQAPDWVRAAI
jgi:endonuclease/exonuclease/phosphatase family metal-dependent hydrolase